MGQNDIKDVFYYGPYKLDNDEEGSEVIAAFFSPAQNTDPNNHYDTPYRVSFVEIQFDVNHKPIKMFPFNHEYVEDMSGDFLNWALTRLFGLDPCWEWKVLARQEFNKKFNTIF